MDDMSAANLSDDLKDIVRELAKQNELQEEANGLMRSLIPALNATAQELLELREHLEKSDNEKLHIPLMSKP